jgi:hypothetical protein
MAMHREQFDTLEGQGFPTVRQISVFLDNRVGQLLRMTQLLEKHNVSILALSVDDSVDYAVVRLLTDDPDQAEKFFQEAGFAISITELLVVRLPATKRGLLTVWSSLLSSEINISYAYPLLAGGSGPTLAIRVDNIEIAIDTLMSHQFQVLGEDDLRRDA